MSNAAIIAPIKVMPHPNADRLQIGQVLGYTVVVGLDAKDGDVGVFFEEGLQLSEEFAKANDLVRRKDPETGEVKGGLFCEKRRVKAQKLRGVKSEGFWMPVAALGKLVPEKNSGILPSVVGTQLTEFEGIPLCSKYITPATRNSHSGNSVKGIKTRRETLMFKAHFETDQLKVNLHTIKPGDLVVLTLKLHGTSQRIGRVLDDIQLPKWKKLVNRILWPLTKTEVFKTREWTYLSGTRNVILRAPSDAAWHGEDLRTQAAKPFLGKIHKGESIYFEVVGYEPSGTPIMGTHGVDDKELKKQYGDKVVYHYGCQPKEHKIFVYRITQTNEDGYTVELPWLQVKARCEELGVPHVPEIGHTSVFLIHTHAGDAILPMVEDLSDGPDPLGKTHPREGIAVRVESGHRTRIYKLKGWSFRYLEGLVKEREDYVDTEEAA